MKVATPYSGTANRRQRARLAASLVLVMAAALSGCASLGLPFGPDLTRVSRNTTGSILVSTSGADAVDPSDWETVRKTVAAIPADRADTVEWTNPATGSTGSVVTVVIGAAPKTAVLCRSFSTTVSDPRGVRRYRGQACRESDGRWDLKAIAADDVVLS